MSTKTKTATLWVGYLDTGGISYSGSEILAAGKTEDDLFAAIGAAYDSVLAREGDDREPFLNSNEDVLLDVLEEGQSIRCTFGTDLDLFGKVLNDLYGIRREEVKLGEGVVFGY